MTKHGTDLQSPSSILIVVAIGSKRWTVRVQEDLSGEIRLRFHERNLTKASLIKPIRMAGGPAVERRREGADTVVGSPPADVKEGIPS